MADHLQFPVRSLAQRIKYSIFVTSGREVDAVAARRGPDGSPNMLDLTLGRRIRQQRKARGMTLADLTRAGCPTPSQILKYEKGQNQVGFSELVNIAHALQCRVLDLVDNIGAGPNPGPPLDRDIAYLRTPGADKLLAAYCAVPATVRRNILNIVEDTAASLGYVRPSRRGR